MTRRQLLGLGLHEAAIRYRVGAGRLIRLHHGVYAVGHAPTTPLGRAAAAVLACGKGSGISHDSGISLWGWRTEWRMPLEITAPSLHRRPGLRVHRATGLSRTDIRIQLGIRVTSPARTILDVAPRLKTRRAVTRLVNDARESAHLQLSALADVLRRFPRHPGAELLAPFITAPTGPTRSEFEIAFVEFAETHGLPRPEMNAIVGGHLVDAWFAAERLVVELDSYRIHWTAESFESDRDRDADLLDRLAIPTVRVTWERITERPVAEAARLHRILADRRRR